MPTPARVAPTGLHHVTAVVAAPDRNVEFYARTLGLRLVKRTVNFEAPESWHLYYGDTSGTPGSLLTFFPWPGVPRGREGTGLATAVAFSVPEGSLGWWARRLRDLGVDVGAPRGRDGEDVLSLRDPDGLALDLVASPADTRSGWDGAAGIDAGRAVRGLHSVTLTEAALERTAAMLTDLLAMAPDGTADSAHSAGRARFTMAGGGAGAALDVAPGRGERGRQAGGTVHHVAFRAPDLATMTAWRGQLLDAGVEVTGVRDRQYFRSIYFREPGGVLFEIATDEPGFTTDEPLLELGRALRLPPWLEPDREQIAAALPDLRA